jgi:hypothetical protein
MRTTGEAMERGKKREKEKEKGGEPILSVRPPLFYKKFENHPPLLRCSTRPAPRTLTEAHTSKRKQPSEARLRMSGGKACGKQAAAYTRKQPDEGSAVTSRDTAAPENEVHSSGHTHRKSMRLTEMSTANQVGGKEETEKDKQPAAHMKWTRTTRQPMQTQPALLAADAFAAALEAVPAEDWCRTWAAGRTIMLRKTSKRVKRGSG